MVRNLLARRQNAVAVAFDDVEFCWLAREPGYRTVWTLDAELNRTAQVCMGMNMQNQDLYAAKRRRWVCYNSNR